LNQINKSNNLNKDGLKVLSLCGGIETGLLALQNLNIPISEYHTYEILPEAIAVSSYHFPWIIHHGDLFEADWNDYKGFDLVIGGMNCQSLSRARIDNKEINNGLLGKSGIVYELQKALDIIQPKWFMSENVIPSNNEDLKELNRIMGVEGILINSNKFSAQDRERYYWTNIPIKPLPESNPLVLKDIMESDVDEKYFYKKDFEILHMDKKVCAELKVNTLDMKRRIYNPNFKCATLTCVSGGYQELKVLDNGRPRKLTEIEYERLQGLPDNFTKVEVNGRKIGTTKRYSLCGNAWTLPVVQHIFGGLVNI
jgi:DNA (cytosine-5)-methyltransferase 3A